MFKYIFAFLIFSPLAIAQNLVQGVLLERGTKIPLKEVSIYILPHKIKTQTDFNGHFEFKDIPEGDFQIVITQTGYKRLEKEDSTDNTRPRNLYLEKEDYITFETTIVGQKQKRDATRKSLNQEDFLNMPGAQGDPVKAVQNLPGVNRVSGFSSNIAIQGSAPEDTQYDIDGHSIPIVFHFGGLTSVIMPEAVNSVDYLSAGYGPEYSKALGGIISLKTRDPETNEREKKGFFFADNLKLGGLFETKIDEQQSLLVSGRYSYVGLFLRAALKDSDAFDLTVAPEFADFTIIYKNKISDVDDFKTTFVASRDTLEFLLKQPVKQNPSLRGTFKNETAFYRFIPQWSHKVDSDRNYKLSLGLGQDLVSFDFGDQFFNLRSNSFSLRGEWEQAVSPTWKYQLGTDNVYDQSDIKFKLPYFTSSGGVSNPVSSSTQREATLESNNLDLGVYWRNELSYLPTTWIPSIRVDQFGRSNEFTFSPRLAARYQWDSSFLLKTSTGLYFQPPTGQQASEEYGNPDVKASQAIHYMLGFEKDFREGRSDGYQLNMSYFYRDFDKLVISSSDYVIRNGISTPEVYNNSGKGLAQGIETQIKYQRTPWKGFVSYTLSKSTRWDSKNSEYPFQYDQTHNFNFVASYDYKNNWQFSTRYRYVTGNPNTPIVGAVFDSDNDVYVPIRGSFYSERTTAFQQLDFRIDKKWIADTEIWSLYLDIQNLLNAKNSESVRYSYDYSQKEDISGLPILPAIGIKGEF